MLGTCAWCRLGTPSTSPSSTGPPVPWHYRTPRGTAPMRVDRGTDPTTGTRLSRAEGEMLAKER